jgi:hypothetical protein
MKEHKLPLCVTTKVVCRILPGIEKDASGQLLVDDEPLLGQIVI